MLNKFFASYTPKLCLARAFSFSGNNLFIRETLDSGHLALCKFNNPAKRNALSKELTDDMEQVLTDLESDETVRSVIVMASEPGFFCAGADLKERLKLTGEESWETSNRLRAIFHRFYKLQVPVIACIDGPCLGGGMEIALSCDIRVATRNSLMGLPEVKLAILPGAGGTQKLPRLIGLALAKELILTGKRFNGDEAVKYGILNYTFDGYEEVYGKCLELAREINKNGPIGVRMAKRALNGAFERPIEEGLAWEGDCYRGVIHTEDRIEGLKAFSEKRTPDYKGK
jgi:methylglutaconyl-CoA hydratase